MKTNISRGLMLAALFALVPSFVKAQVTAGTTATADARIIRGIGIARSQDLYFGDIYAPTTAGTVTVSPASVRTPSGTVIVAGGTVSAATFTVSDNTPGNPKFWVQLPTSITITRAGGGATMTVSNFTSNLAGGCATTLAVAPGPPGGCANSNQNFQLNIGGQLSVAAAQMFGNYTGTFQISVHRF